MTEVVRVLTRATEIREKIWVLVRAEYPAERRATLVLGYTALALEHHEAIELLIQGGKYGSACALARPVVEALFRALWVNACATDEQLEEVTNNDSFPHLDDTVMTAIDAKYSQEDTFFSTVKKQCWPQLCGYAHGGLIQLSKRFRDQRVEPNYSEADLLEIVAATTASIILLGRLLTASTGRVQEAAKIEELMYAWGGGD